MTKRAFQKIEAGLQEALIRTKLWAFYTPEEADLWLKSPQPLLDGRRPIDCPAEEVLRLIDQMETGAYI